MDTEDAGKAGGRRKRKRIGCGPALGLGLVALVVVCLVAHYAPSALIALTVIGLSGGYVFVARKRIAGRYARACGLVLVLSLAIGAALLFLPATRLAGVLLICVGVALLPAFAVEVARTGFTDDSPSDRRALPAVRPRDWAAAVVIGVLAAVFVLDRVGDSARVDDGYYKRYGVPVQADTRGNCATAVGYGRLNGIHYIRCDATWRVDGVATSGTLQSGQLDAFGLGDQHVAAYAVGNTAVAANHLDDLGPVVVLGKLPLRWVGWLFPVALIAWIVLLVRRRRRRAA